MTLSGTLTAPILTGDINLVDFGAEVPAISLKLREGNIKAVSDGTGKLELEGQILSGEGNLSVGGFFNTETGQMEMALQGEDFRVANAERQKATISPDLDIKIDNENIAVTGEVTIPFAFIAAGGESGAIVESTDVKIIEASAAPEEEDEATSRVRLDVDVALGDDVRIKAGQFDGGLGGTLSVEQTPGTPPTGSGVIEVLSGEFFLYGQQLTIERGRILFGGGPLDNPGLDFDVARDVVEYDVRAGAQIRGTAQQPTFELISDPVQTDANTLSYILVGRPVGGASVTLGKYLTPDLYVSYAIDIFDRVQTFNMRYRLSDRLALIGSKNDNKSGGDLFYTIER